MKPISYMSDIYCPTLKEVPAEAEVVSHKLLLKAGMIRKTASGVYSFLPLGHRVLLKIQAIIREEMNAAGSQEILMPAMQPAELWHESGRWDDYGPELMRFKDRHDHDFCLGPTHEEVITTLVKNELRSYKDLPKNLYQIQVKFRDEIRPRFGLLRGREFLMKDSYSFHASQECLQKTYDRMRVAYQNICKRCGLDFREVEADSGQIGGSVTVEFMALAKNGEAEIAFCDCGYAADTEVLGFDANDKTPRDIDCPKCGKKCQIARGIEVSQVFQLGTKYSESMHTYFVGEDGKEHPFLMGCYGIGVTRMLAAAIEQWNDENGIMWDPGIAPAHVCIIPLFDDGDGHNKVAENLASELAKRNVEVVIDNRDQRAGFKFKDADLIGWPYQLVIGKRSLESGNVELKNRRTSEKQEIKLEEVVDKLVNILSI